MLVPSENHWLDSAKRQRRAWCLHGILHAARAVERQPLEQPRLYAPRQASIAARSTSPWMPLGAPPGPLYSPGGPWILTPEVKTGCFAFLRLLRFALLLYTAEIPMNIENRIDSASGRRAHHRQPRPSASDAIPPHRRLLLHTPAHRQGGLRRGYHAGQDDLRARAPIAIFALVDLPLGRPPAGAIWHAVRRLVRRD